MNDVVDNPLFWKSETAHRHAAPEFSNFVRDAETRKQTQDKIANLRKTSTIFKIFGEDYFGMVRADDLSLNIGIRLIDVKTLSEKFKETLELQRLVAWMDYMAGRLKTSKAKDPSWNDVSGKEKWKLKASHILGSAHHPENDRYVYAPLSGSETPLIDAINEFAHKFIMCELSENEIDMPVMTPGAKTFHFALMDAVGYMDAHRKK